MTARYAGTTVAVEKSQGDIRKILLAHNVKRITLHSLDEDYGSASGIEFVHDGTQIRILAKHRPVDRDKISAVARRSRTRSFAEIARDDAEQETARIWRVLYWTISARFTAIDEDLETFEQAFLPHVVDPTTNRTVWETLEPSIADGAFQLTSGERPALPSPLAAW